jgi:hypothetical protein
VDLERLTYMANQIARNLAAILGGDLAGLDPIAKAAVERLDQ